MIGFLSAFAWDRFGRFLADTRGTTAIEYGLIAAGISAVIIVTVYNLGNDVKTNLWDKVGAIF
jgi:pilus assembly protein Flp/PilA